jgi:hypothetical protein
MNIPGFSAEASLFTPTGYNKRTRNKLGNIGKQGIIPQFDFTGPLPRERDIIWGIPMGGGARLPASPTPCDWYRFRCLEYHDQFYCQKWHLQCVPE